MSTQRTTSSAMIAVIEKARGRSERHFSSRLLSLALIAVFFVALMGSLVAGASLYKATVTAQQAANELHLQSGLITNLVRSNDYADSVAEVAGPEGPALVLTKRTARRTYETRIYRYAGHVVQEFAVEGRPFDPQGATELLATDTFAFALEDGLVTFTTDAGSFCVALRSDSGAVAGEGGAA